MPRVPMWPKILLGILIMDLSLTTVTMGLLRAWHVDDEHATGLDHELPVMKWVPMEQVWDPPCGKVTGW